MSARFVSLAAAFLVAGMLPAAGQSGLVEAGAAIAREACASCHAIESGPDKKAPVAAPSFAAIAAAPAMSELAIKVFLQTPHATMPNIMLAQNEIDALAAYILSLRAQ